MNEGDQGSTTAPLGLGPLLGSVVWWNIAKGLGVLQAADLSGQVIAFFSIIDSPGFRQLKAGQQVQFWYDTPGQDGYDHRATLVRPLDEPPPVS